MNHIAIVGGPNGAGKTTAAQVLLPRGLELIEFINADEIARGLSPFNAEAVAVPAGRIMIGRTRDLANSGTSFAFETTCAGHSSLRIVGNCKAMVWQATLLFLWLPSPQLALERVRRRVRSGGHAIPSEVVVRRYWAGLINMRARYLALADVAAIYDNSDRGRILVASKSAGASLDVHDAKRWAMIEGATP